MPHSQVYDIDSETTLSSDDLDRTKTRNKVDSHDATFHDNTSDEQDIDERPRKRSKREAGQESERIKFSSGSEIEGEAVYKSFKSRKSDARKRAAKSTRKAKAIAREQNPQTRPSAGNDTKVGRNATKKTATGNKQTVYGDDSEDDLMEWTVPEYLQRRRSNFDTRIEKLKSAGLKLPPSFDDVDFSDDDHLEELHERPDFIKLKPCAPYKDIQLPYSLGLIPAPIAQWLRDYQVQGASFLHELFVYQKGGILGDDMGLGKTVQVAAFLAAAYGKTGDERDAKRMRKMRRKNDSRWYPRTLIICPGSLIANWRSELNRWGWWHVDKYHGSASEKEAALAAAATGRLEIMITTYTTYRLNKSAINIVPWDCVVADECHTIKERHSEITQAMNEVNALCRIGLTGTAIQNKYEELWTLLNWTNPGRLGPITTWKASISEPLKVGQSHNATVYQLSRARKVARQLVDNLLPQFFIRRMKTLIADQLPKKSDRVVFCPMTSTQTDAYENFVNSEIVQAIKTSSDPCDCGRKGKKRGWCCYTMVESPTGELGKWQNYVFPAIFNLQRLANHLALLIPQGTDKLEKQSKDLEMLQICLPDRWEQLYRERDNIIHYSDPSFCGKWRILQKLLKFWHVNGDKVLVFSHSVRLLKMLQMLFNHTSYNVSYLDGSMSLEDRAKTVDEFNSDENQFVFLISTRAGGVGLNITSANKVVVVDPNWNPSHDLQAQDRAYRIGQTRDVEVFRLVSAGTIEEIVYARQIYKQQQANIGYNASSERRYFQGVQERTDMKGEIFGLSNLFELRREGTVVLKDIVNKTNVAESRAGVSVAGYEMPTLKDDDDGDDSDADEQKTAIKSEEGETAAISQIAALITSQGQSPSSKKSKEELNNEVDNPFDINAPKPSGKKKHDPVQAILAAAGVQYTHENSEVIGTSKVEARISKNAEEALTGGADFDVKEGDRRIFVDEPQQDGQMDDFAHSSDDNSFKVNIKHHPPDDVIRRQFCEMARWAGFDSAVEFGLVVEGWTQADRRECLDRFYSWRKKVISAQEIGSKQPDGEMVRNSRLTRMKTDSEDEDRKPIVNIEQDAKARSSEGEATAVPGIVTASSIIIEDTAAVHKVHEAEDPAMSDDDAL